MKSIIILCALMLIAAPALAVNVNDHTSPYDADANTLLLMHFDQSAPDVIATDASGNGDNGDLYVSNTGAVGNPATFWTTGQAGFGNAGDFNSYQFLQVPDVDESLDWSSLTGDMTIDFWLGPQALNRASAFVLKTVDGSYSVQLHSAGANDHQVRFMWAGFTGVSDTTLLPMTAWNHVRITVDKTTKAGIGKMDVDFYINGALSTSNEVALSAAHNAGSYGMQIGNNSLAPNATAYFNQLFGSLDELRISDVNRGAPVVIPEPASISLIGLVLATLIRRKK